MLVIVDFDDRCFQFRIGDLEPATRFRWLSKRKNLFEQVRWFDEPNNLFFDSWRDGFHVDSDPDRAPRFLPDESQDFVKRRDLQAGESRMEPLAGVEFTDLIRGQV